MCGIAGIVANAGGQVSADEIRRMAERLVHRGPDEGGEHLGPGVGLAVRRLRIIDLVTGGQPICGEDRSIWTVFNGEIYNFADVRADLERCGHHFRTRTDTECVVHGYEEWGASCIERFRGMFALAIWDEARRELTLARDRLGKKPLVYGIADGRLVFASEIQALLTVPGIDRRVDLGALGDYLAYGYVPGPATIFTGIRKLEPAHVLTWSQGGLRVHRYWQLAYEPKIAIDEDAAVAELERRLDDAVRARLVADVPIGALLSGGVDSSTVVALMARHTQRVKTFSVGFDDSAYDELAHARRVAERYGTDHHEFVVRAEAASVLPTLVRHYGEPFADSSAIPTFLVSKLARSHVTVALNGDGGDESFAGYDRYVGVRLAELAGRTPLLPSLGIWGASIVGTLADGRGKRVSRFLRTLRAEPRGRYARWLSVIPPEVASELISPALAATLEERRSHAVERSYLDAKVTDEVDRALATDVATYLPYDLLVKMDVASMAASLETRSPLLDHEVVEFAARLPARLKLGRGVTTKYLLKRLARRLVPVENIDRAKMGFSVPIGSWLRNELRGQAEDALLGDRAWSRGYFVGPTVRRLWTEHQEGTVDRSGVLWSLFMLELWHQEFVDAAILVG